MTTLKEIALRVATKMGFDAPPQLLRFSHALLAELSKQGPLMPDYEGRELTQKECYRLGYEAAKAELSKDAKPYAFEIETENNFGGLDKWVTTDTKHYMDFCDRGEPKPLFTHPLPTAEIEQRVAKAFVHYLIAEGIINNLEMYIHEIKLGKWREYL